MEVFLYNSTVCRLCGEENDNGTLLYSCEENSQNLSDLINAYLPVKVTDDGQLPRTICPGCTIQLEATVEFMNLIINGQKIIRELHQREKEYKSNLLNNTSKEEDVITENVVYEITSDGLYQVEHPVALAAAGLDKPKRKRGRPPKKHKLAEAQAQAAAKPEEHRPDPLEEPSGKRRRKTPTRFREAVQGKELERIFIEEGVTDGDSDHESQPEAKPDAKPAPPKEPEVIGHMENSGELVVVVKGKGRGRPKGRMRQTRQECAICGTEFSCVGRYMSHVAGHGPVLYRCRQCGETFSTRLHFTSHQRDSQHQGQVIIPCAQKPEQEEGDKKPSLEVTPAQDTLDLAPVDALVSNACRGLPDLNPTPLDEPAPEDSPAVILPAPTNGQNSETMEVNKTLEDTIDKKEVIIDEREKTAEEEVDDKTKKGKQKLKCNHCDKLFSNKQSKSLHIKAAHQGERPYVCGECGAAFAYPRSLSLHTLSHRRQRAQPKGYACDLCGKVLNHPSSVVYHKEAEHAGQRYVCNKCGKSFKHKQLLQRHQLVHSQHRPFDCKTCNASFKTKANLINHQLLHTGVKKFTCEICKHKFAHKTSLTLHMRWHTGHKPFSCGKCGKSFSQKGNLSEHERIHTGEKPYECSQCNRRFTTSSQHRLHARRHNADRPYACASCGKRFVSRGSWAAHARREAAAGAGGAAGRAHRCGSCGRAFAERWALLKHMRRHTGERPFRCPHCPRAFADASNLNKHKRQVHKQISLLAQTKSEELPPAPAEAPEEEERVIYVAYDIDDKDDTAYHIIDPDQGEVEVEEESKVAESLYSRGSLLVPVELEPQKHMPVTDEQGNPLHFTMQDGTRLAITSADGQSLQVITQDGQTIPVEINGYADEEEMEENPDTIVHQLNLQKSVEVAGSSPVTHFFTIV